MHFDTQLNEYEQKEKVCTRRWNSLLQETLHKEEISNGLRAQLFRQKENYQNVIALSDRRLMEANARLSNQLGNEERQKKQAAEFLVDQMQIISKAK